MTLKASFLVVVFLMGGAGSCYRPDQTEQEASQKTEGITDDG